MMLLDEIDLVYDPFPIGTVASVFTSSLYQEMARQFPAANLFEYKPSLGRKYSLSEVNNAEHYYGFVRSHRVWNDFYNWIKRDDFPYEILERLAECHIDLGLRRKTLGMSDRARLSLSSFGLKPRNSSLLVPRLRSRFEFSMLPADGGFLKPHTDSPQKVITLVVAMPQNGEWQPQYGGATEVMRPKDIRRNFNFMNRQMEFEEVETLRRFEYQANHCVIFIKTFNSLHGVLPMTGFGADLMRKTLTINIEQMDVERR